MSGVLDALHKLEVDRMTTIQSVLRTAAEADRKLATKTMAAVSTSVEAFEIIDVEKDINSFIVKVKKSEPLSREYFTV